VRILGFLFVSGLAHFLLARWYLSTFPAAAALGRRRRVFGLAGALSLLLVTVRLVAAAHESSTVRAVTAVAFIELIAVMFALVPIGLMALGIRVGTGLRSRFTAPPSVAAVPETPAPVISRRQSIERVAGITLVGATTSALGWGMVRGRHAFALEEVVVRVKGWPRALDGYVIAQVSDVHVGVFVGERELNEGFELVKKLRPDLVVATGDLVDFESEAVGHLAKRLLDAGARDGAYAIVGNHDHYAGAADVVSRLRATGVQVLSNEAQQIRRADGGGFALVGVDDLQGRKRPAPGFAGPDLGAATSRLDPDLPRILLAHQPQYFRESAGRVALQLSGHTHGGQINPGFRPADLLMEYVAGRFERDGSTLWVNRGFGVSGPPSRVGAPPEITKIVIVAA
jgi:hypothetical protein